MYEVVNTHLSKQKGILFQHFIMLSNNHCRIKEKGEFNAY